MHPKTNAILIDHDPNWLDLHTNDLATWNSYMANALLTMKGGGTRDAGAIPTPA